MFGPQLPFRTANYALWKGVLNAAGEPGRLSSDPGRSSSWPIGIRHRRRAFLVCGLCPAAAEEPCRLTASEQKAFLPKTASPENLRPLAQPGEALPDDCGFYKWAWQAFLYATQPTNGRVALLSMPTFEDVFKAKESPLFADQEPNLLSLAPRSSKVGNKTETSHFRMTDELQAGSQQVLVDPRGNVVWYAIHLNKTYQAFIEAYDLRDRKTLNHEPRDLAFRTGSLELKSAWQIVKDPAPKNYISTKALIPVFKTTPSGDIVKDGDKTRIVTVALLGIHVVGTIEGHPEFIWSTFEHVNHGDKAWVRDVAPAAQENSDGKKPVLVEKQAAAYSLYPADPAHPVAAPVANANSGNGIYNLKLDEKTQTFAPKSSVYRQFPASKSDDSKEDDAVTSVNEAIRDLFMSRAPADVRSNYQLVGAIWLNTPEDDFKADVNFMDAAAKTRKQPLFGGEDRLSSTTMESFTQSADSFPNCFSCHNTESVSGIAPSRLNMSHALSKYYSLRAATN